MAPTKSYELGPLNGSPISIFLRSQYTQAVPIPPFTSAKGLTVLLTGGYQGIGLACMEQLIDMNVSRLIIAGRTVKKGEEAIQDMEKKFPGKLGPGPDQSVIEMWEVDMASYKSVQAFVEKVKTLDRLDVAFLNAGILLEQFTIGPEGHEEIIQVNYISTVLLAHLLLPIMSSKSTREKPSRLSVVNSGTALFAKLAHKDQDNFLSSYTKLSQKSWDPMEQYSASKAMTHLWIMKLVEKMNSDKVIVNLVDPGLVKGTRMHRDFTSVMGLVFALIKIVTGRTLKNGASALIDAAFVKGRETHGSFVMDWKIVPYAHQAYGENGDKLADKLWGETMAEIAFAEPEQMIARM